jgi:hypothetical protein
MRPIDVSASRTVLCAAVIAALGLSMPAHALPRPDVVRGDLIAVTSCADSGPGSLREAVASATTNDLIDLSQLPCSDSTITLTTGAIAVTVDGLTIAGVPLARPSGVEGNVTPHVIIDGNVHSRIFDHTGSGWLQLFGVTLRNGIADQPGGCVHSTGSMALVSSVISGCTVDTTTFSASIGGGLYVGHDLYMTESLISANTVHGYSFVRGGGVFVVGTFTMKNSTISDNSAIANSGVFGFGGGVYASSDVSMSYSTISGNSATDIGGADLLGQDGASLSIANCTISGNHGGTTGGLLALQAPLHIASSTIAFNTATNAAGTGGIALGNPSTFESTLVANNTAANVAADVHAQCGVGGSCDTIVITGANNLFMSANLTVPADTLVADPHLAPLSNNGGPTRTHALTLGSAAIDHGNADGIGGNCLSYDQRGNQYLRAVGANVDIGAFEFGAGPDRIFANGFDNESESTTPAAPEQPSVCP